MDDGRNPKEQVTDGGGERIQFQWVGLEDDSSGIMRMVGRLIKNLREKARLTQAEFGAAIGYGEEMVSKVERGIRIPKAEFLDNADRVLKASGLLSGLKPEVADARYPKKLRDLAKLEAEAVELGAYVNTAVEGLLQTEEYARANFRERCPAYSDDEVEHLVAARMARKGILQARPAPLLTFVQEEATLRRPIGGRMVLRSQLEHLLELGRQAYVRIQVMPTTTEEHAGLSGSLRVLKLKDGSTVCHDEVSLTARLITDPREVQVVEMRYGMIRAQALTPRESLAFIEKLRGDT